MLSATHHRADPTLRERHPRLFAIEDWRDLYRDRRRRCPDCGGYVWLDMDGTGRHWLACSACGWEEML